MIKREANSSLHQHILSQIERNIVSGIWPPGFKIPIEVELAKSYNVSRMTVNKAMTKLAECGLIERRKRYGSFVAMPRAQSAILEIHDVETEVRSLKLDYNFKLLNVDSRQATKADCHILGVGKESSLLIVDCLHYAGEGPFCFEQRLINLETVPEAADVNYHLTPPGPWLQAQVPWTTAEHKIMAQIADSDTANLLVVQKNTALLVVERRTWNENGIVTFVRFNYPSQKHALSASFTPTTTQ